MLITVTAKHQITLTMLLKETIHFFWNTSNASVKLIMIWRFYFVHLPEKKMELCTIKLSKSEVEELDNVIRKGSHTSQAFRAAYILLNCDKGEFSENTEIKNSEICKILKIGERTIDRVKKKFIEEGFEGVLEMSLS